MLGINTPMSVVKATITPDADRAYAIFWYVEAGQTSGGSGSTDFHDFQLSISGLPNVQLVHARGRNNAALFDWPTHSGVWVLPASSTPTPTVIEMVGRCNTAARPQGARNGRLVIVRLEANDLYALEPSRLEASTAPYTGVSIATTPPGAGSYIGIGSVALDATTNVIPNPTFLSTTTEVAQAFTPAIGQTINRANDSTFFIDSMFFGRVAASASQTIYLRVNNAGGGNTAWGRSHCMVLLWEPDLGAATLTEDRDGFFITVGASYQEMYSAVVPAPAQSRLLLASHQSGSSSAAGEIFSRFLSDGSVTHRALIRTFSTLSTRGYTSTYVGFERDVQANRSYKIETSRPNASGTVATTFRQILALDFNANVVGVNTGRARRFTGFF